MTLCTGYALRSRHPCDREATETVTAGCLHEHIGDRPSCGLHAQQYDRGLMFCGNCQDSTDPHECALVPMQRSPIPAEAS